MHDYDSQLSELHERILGNILSDDEGTNYGEALFDSIKHIHAHDNYGDDDSHLALGEGSIDLKHIINKFWRKISVC